MNRPAPRQRIERTRAAVTALTITSAEVDGQVDDSDRTGSAAP